MLRIRNKLNFKLIGLTLIISMFLGVGFTLSSYASEPTDENYMPIHLESNSDETNNSEQFENGNYYDGPEIFIDTPAEDSNFTEEEQSSRSRYPALSSVNILGNPRPNYKGEWVVDVKVMGTHATEWAPRLNGAYVYAKSYKQHTASGGSTGLVIGTTYTYNFGKLRPGSGWVFTATFRSLKGYPKTISAKRSFNS